MKTSRYVIVATLMAAGCITTGHAAIIADVTESITGTVTIPTTATDFVIYDAGAGTVRKNESPNLISAISSDSSVGNDGNVGTLFGLEWSDGNPTTSGTSYAYQYLGFGPGYSPQATYASVDLTMPSTSGIFILWLLANPNGGNSMQFDVTFGKTGDEFSETYSTPTNAKVIQFEFDLSEFNVNDTLTFRVDNVSGINNWHNVGIYGAQFMIPEPGTIMMLIPGLGALIGWRQRGRRLRAGLTENDPLAPAQKPAQRPDFNLLTALEQIDRKIALAGAAPRKPQETRLEKILLPLMARMDSRLQQFSNRCGAAADRIADRFWSLLIR